MCMLWQEEELPVRRRGLKKKKMIELCEEEWPRMTAVSVPGERWPRGGSFETAPLLRVRRRIGDTHPDQLEFWLLWKIGSQKWDSLTLMAVRTLSIEEPPPHYFNDDTSSKRTVLNRSIIPSAPDPLPGAGIPIRRKGPFHLYQMMRQTKRGKRRGPQGAWTRASEKKEKKRKEAEALEMPLLVHDQLYVDGHGGIQRTEVVELKSWLEWDLKEWSRMAGTFGEQPRRIRELLGRLFESHNPTYSDVEHLLRRVLTGEERSRLWTMETAWAVEAATNRAWSDRAQTAAAWAAGDWMQPRRAQLQTDRDRILTHLERMSQKPLNQPKCMAIKQEASEPPRKFWSRLLEGARSYTNLNPENVLDHPTLIANFVHQAQPAVRDYFLNFRPGRWGRL
ncbi:uncharacterized protein LOC133385530 [Rhineura floridana]|uniref:uncharacterized protein LOC133385530 n=1 Tax=Rhineura floridana TaxID=261503 RepID=UPI002AC7FCE4|nr:uncharacterized protein LOC133385530 [Rhineura floridana]